MHSYRQFVLYRLVPSPSRPGKTDKLPCSIDGQVVSAHNPQYWMDFATAQAAAALFGEGWGIGFVFTAQDPFWFLDIDGCLIDGQWSPLAVSLCNLLAGCAVEISQSGTGLHIFGSGVMPPHACKNTLLGLELYHEGRFVALTGAGAVGDAHADMSAVLPALVAQYFPAVEEKPRELSDGPSPDWNGPKDDEELIRRAMLSKSASSVFGTKASFADLWRANEPALALTYPDPVRAYDESSADAALAQHLCFWTGCDAERIERLMHQSALVRDKWEREDYLPRTIAAAISRQIEVLQDAPGPELGVPATATVLEWQPPAVRAGNGYMNPEQQKEHFKGCVYITSLNRALTPGGIIMKSDAFRVQYGGYIFNLDNGNEKTTRDAWEAWTVNQAHRVHMVNGTCFKPDMPPGAIISRHGQLFVNTYVPVDVPRKQGDPSRFLAHLAKVLPNERDQRILLSYMAACVQHQGYKFQWAPLIQGVEGNGKSLFTRCVANAVGQRYTHWPNAADLHNVFNAWMMSKVFFAVEDIYVPDSKREIMEALKPMITGGDGFQITMKGYDSVSEDICGNFMFNSNHKDAIHVTDNSRRFCIFYSAQQEVSDIARDGMRGDYFPSLYRWLNEGGYAIVTDYLYNYAIPDELNPAGDCQRAPETSTSRQAIAESKGNVEQEIEEAIEQGKPGFCGDWISSIFLHNLLDGLRMTKIGPSKRKEILARMGYVPHPALVGGRVNNNVVPDNTKPRLFVKKDSLSYQITSPAEVAKSYEHANRNPVGLPFAIRA